MIGAMMNFEDLTDEQLEAARLDALAEQERRANLEQIPAMVAELAAKYIAGGGAREQLESAIKTAN